MRLISIQFDCRLLKLEDALDGTIVSWRHVSQIASGRVISNRTRVVNLDREATGSHNLLDL